MYPTADNLVAFKHAKAMGKRVRLQAKNNSWRSFVTSINFTDTRKEWNRIRKLNGQMTYNLSLVNSTGDTLEDQANALAKHFEHVSSSSHYTSTFIQYKKSAERKSIRNQKETNNSYNCPFSLHELMAALAGCKTSVPGADNITYTMIKHLHADTLLFLYKKIWCAGRFPKSWKQAIVAPLLKQGKDLSCASSYPPIALTSCLCKLFEKMVNRRLLYFLKHSRTPQ